VAAMVAGPPPTAATAAVDGPMPTLAALPLEVSPFAPVAAEVATAPPAKGALATPGYKC
jgi:hypothetical protein